MINILSNIKPTMIKNILLIMPNIEKGGIEKNLLLLSTYLAKNSKISLVCSEISNNIKNNLDSRIKLIISKKYIKTKLFPRRIRNTINSFLEIYIKKKEIINKKTIILSLQNHPFPILLAKIFNKKIFIRIANHPYSSIRFFNNYFLFIIKLFVKLFFYRFADGIICNSNSSRLFLKKYLPKNSMITIFNPLKYNNKIKTSNIRKDLLTVGRLESQKNIEGILLALDKVKKCFPKIRLIIIGSGSKKNLLKKIVNEKKLQNNVKFKGYINPNKYLLSSKILILNSFFEGMPNILLEGLAHKIPIISTNCKSGPNEILCNGKYGTLTVVNNNILLAKKIIKTLNNYSNALKKAEVGFKSLKRFDFDMQLKKIENYIFNIKN